MIGPRDIRKFLKRFGITDLKLEEIPNIQKVTLHRSDGSHLEIEMPIVAKVKIGNVVILQIQTEESKIKEIKPTMREEKKEDLLIIREEKKLYTDEDVVIVMEQTGCSRDEAIKALEEAKGDLAKAIIMIQEKKGK
ncbi:MAG: ubiquitin [Thermoprotei archaeon ex4572_64]|nr:MAG: ubiquitin [Thermoprotei archaeon ex4572_64]